MYEKEQWKSEILSEDATHQPAFLLKISLFHRCFSHILLVKTNHLAFPLVEHWLEISQPFYAWWKQKLIHTSINLQLKDVVLGKYV